MFKVTSLLLNQRYFKGNRIKDENPNLLLIVLFNTKNEDPNILIFQKLITENSDLIYISRAAIPNQKIMIKI